MCVGSNLGGSVVQLFRKKMYHVGASRHDN